MNNTLCVDVENKIGKVKEYDRSMKISKVLKGVGMGSAGALNIACGLAIQSMAPFSRLMGGSSPKNEAFENSKYFFHEASVAFKEAVDDD